MHIQENSRQIPKDKNTLANKGFNDLMYGYLQSISEWDGDPLQPRYILKKKLRFTELAQALGVTRQTASNYFHKMILDDPKYSGKGYPALIRELDDRYELITLDKKLSMLVPKKTLIVLVSALNENAISIYAYLLNRYIASGECSFQFTKEELKNVIGISCKSHNNADVINGILFVLQKLGLLKAIEKLETTPNGQRTYCYITYMTNKIDDEIEFDDSPSRDLYKFLLSG